MENVREDFLNDFINLICEDVQRKCEGGECDDMGNESNGFVDG